jgi:hypothetical protein
MYEVFVNDSPDGIWIGYRGYSEYMAFNALKRLGGIPWAKVWLILHSDLSE